MTVNTLRQKFTGHGVLLAAVALLVFYYTIQAYFYLNQALIPDEILFIEHATRKYEGSGIGINPFLYSNDFGYGSIYWWLHSLLTQALNPQLSARVLYFFFLVSSVLLLFLIFIKNRSWQLISAVILFLLLPMSCSQGKITGPEPLSHLFLVLSLYVLLDWFCDCQSLFVAKPI